MDSAQDARNTEAIRTGGSVSKIKPVAYEKELEERTPPKPTLVLIE